MKKTLAAFALATVMMVGTTFANGGIIITNFAGSPDGKVKDPCTETTKNDLGGIIVSDFGGIIITNLVGIIITNMVDEGPVNCGIIITN